MIFNSTSLEGVQLIEPEKLKDERGFFARTFCIRDFHLHGINMQIVQANISYNRLKHTLRGMHYQAPPYEEEKIVQCTKGAIYGVLIDIRPDSTTFTEWAGFNLSGENRNILYIPKGFAHGFLTLKDHTEVIYLMSEFHRPDAERGIRWNDSFFEISWPDEIRIISEKDQKWPPFNPKSCSHE